MADEAASTRPIHWQCTVRPHRSLPPRGFHLVMAGLGLASFGASVLFTLKGAWPVGGFFGLDVAALYLAFRASYRSGKARETLRLVEDSLTVERVSIRGEVRFWQFQAWWLRVRLEETGQASNRLLLTSHGRTLAVAGFLPPSGRRVLAAELETALTRWRAASRPRGPGY